MPHKRGGQTNGRTSDRWRKLSDLRINGIFGALEYSEDGVFEDGQTQGCKIEILDLLPVRS